jgi:hypothetical protein
VSGVGVSGVRGQKTEVGGQVSEVQPRRWPEKRPVKSKKKLRHDKCRINEFFLFYLLKRAEQSDIHNSSIVIRHSMKFHKDFGPLMPSLSLTLNVEP